MIIKPKRTTRNSADKTAPDFFADAWTYFFSEPIHLDHLLSKVDRDSKSLIAMFLSVFLRAPIASSEILGGSAKSAQLGSTRKAFDPFEMTVDELLHDQRPKRYFETFVASSTWSIEEMFVLQDKIVATALKNPSREFPKWLVELLVRDWGKVRSDEIMCALIRNPTLDIRVNDLREKEMIAATLRKDFPDISWSEPELSPYSIRSNQYVPVLNTELFRNGHFELQDLGSQRLVLAALTDPMDVSNCGAWPNVKRLFNAKSNIIDTCAGSGGKSLALSSLMNGKGRVFAYDIVQYKLESLRARAKRAHRNNIQTRAISRDLEAIGEKSDLASFHGTGDLVMIDAPCSGLGVLRRNPDAKWPRPAKNRRSLESNGDLSVEFGSTGHQVGHNESFKPENSRDSEFPDLRTQPEVIRDMGVLQLKLLNRFQPLTKKGGYLFYSTCTFTKSETTEVREQFHKMNPNYVLCDEQYFGPEDSDGFYYFRSKNCG